MERLYRLIPVVLDPFNNCLDDVPFLVGQV
jgi:hypothetical protein